MILHSRGSHRDRKGSSESCRNSDEQSRIADHKQIVVRKDNFIDEHQFQRLGNHTVVQNQHKSFIQKNSLPGISDCKAQQRLLNLITKSKTDSVQPKLLTNFSKNKSVDPKPVFVNGAKNHENKDKLSNPISEKCNYEGYLKNPLSKSDCTLKKTTENSNSSLTVNRVLCPSTLHSITGKKYISSSKHFNKNTRPLRISEALELHTKENTLLNKELNPAYDTGGRSQNNEPKENSFFPRYIENVVEKFENLRISEFRENYLVADTYTTKDDDEDETDYNNQASCKVFRTVNDNVSVRSYNPTDSKHLTRDISPNFTDLPNDSLSTADHRSFSLRNSFNGHQKSISIKSLKKNNLEKGLYKQNTSSKIDGLRSNTFHNPREISAYNWSKPRSPMSSESSTESNDNSLSDSSLSNKDRSIKKRIDSDGWPRLPDNFSIPKLPTRNAWAKEAAEVSRNIRSFIELFGQFPEDMERISRRYRTNGPLFSMSGNIVSKSVFPTEYKIGPHRSNNDHPAIKKWENPKALPSKPNSDNLSRNSPHQLMSYAGSEQKMQKVVNDGPKKGSAISPSDFRVNQAPKESKTTIFAQPFSGDNSALYRDYKVSQQQRLRNAKSCSDFDTTQGSSCLAQQRLRKL